MGRRGRVRIRGRTSNTEHRTPNTEQNAEYRFLKSTILVRCSSIDYIASPPNLGFMKTKRRSFIRQLGGWGAGAVATPILSTVFINKLEAASRNISNLSAAEAATNEDYWATIQQAYTSSPGVINMNNGGVSPQPLIVQDALDRYNRIANEGPAYYMWNTLGKGRETVRDKLAKLAACSPEEIAIDRNSSEALETIIYGLDLKKGDEILTSNQVYPNMKAAWEQRKEREGVKMNYVSIPIAPKDLGEITQRFKDAITPKTKVILVMHMVNLTGQITPVREIADLAHEKGIKVIVDGAHTFGHLDYSIPDLGCDYFGTSLHKWLSAPFGTGMLWIKSEHIKSTWPLFGSPDPFSEDIRKFEHLGTRSFPAELAIGHAINFHNAIGSKRKQERLHYLKRYWADKALALSSKVKMNVSVEPEHSCALSNFRIEGMDPADIQKKLWKDHNIYTITIKHKEIQGIRVTPHVYSTLDDLDRLVDGIKEMV